MIPTHSNNLTKVVDSSIQRSRFTPEFLTNLIALINELFGADYLEPTIGVIDDLKTLEMTDAYPEVLFRHHRTKINDLRDVVEAGIDEQILDEISDIVLLSA